MKTRSAARKSQPRVSFDTSPHCWICHELLLDQGKSVTITVTDRCAACALTDLDFAPSAFDILADPSVGRISNMTWFWA